ncbi:aconitase subunit 2 [Burkholderia sp. Leaf177]|uniref:aconitase X swivel domain-containing protein n=1 Tax=Burkholderia sp. Leaf177 TaxID=1736287 RepID=UPI0006F2CEDB|nr:DUF126 domain-containing protein [Burkholderia sp. Leaf177]KQR81817.1 aconitase subunit 2 [Burkholderia sp. Leaf177]
MAKDPSCLVTDCTHVPASRYLEGDALCAGVARAEKIVLEKPLSFWGGYDCDAGLIIDKTHPQYGESLAGKIMIMAHAKGSSSSSSVLAEAIRNGTGPAGIVLRDRDLIISIGAIVADELYGVVVPVVCLASQDFEDLLAGVKGGLRIEAVEGVGGAKVFY